MVDANVRRIDEPGRRKIGFSVFHALSLASIGAAIVFFIAGRIDLAIFVGLCSPTIEALRAAAENRHTTEPDSD
jgi:hypothetical protein